jgi:hypothetical protein
MIVVVAFALRSLANYSPNARTSRAADNGPLQATAKDRAQHSSAGPADQRALPRPNSALTVIVVVVAMVVIVRVAIVVVVAAMSAAAHPVVIGTIVVVILLPCYRKNRTGKNKRSDKDRRSNLGHSPLDAGFCIRGLFPLRIPAQAR